MDFDYNCLTGLLKRTAILNFVTKNGLFSQELRAGLAAGCMVSSAVFAIGSSRTVTFDMTTLATSSTYSSKFLTPVLAVEQLNWNCSGSCEDCQSKGCPRTSRLLPAS
ncbi:hypothetical protein PoB_006782100 [Plakobranchus ocellatus]|uniref:Uncharacterized protein n=1 Tax=Plakobranchus ocellatus TaxID=259542 RepID=A0AAV4DB68_9GAST|nr:hypothetical protein PoB_006782100 [Plakobranchus ocellatus]